MFCWLPTRAVNATALSRLLVSMAILTTSESVRGQTDVSSRPADGKLVGRFVYDGEPPEAEHVGRLNEVTLETPAQRDASGRISGCEIGFREYLRLGVRPDTVDHSLLVGSNGGVANVFIYVSSKDIPSSSETQPPEPFALRVKAGQFVPRTLCIRTNQTLLIENQDKIAFNFFTSPYRNSGVNVLVGADKEKQVRFPKTEFTPLQFRSNLQCWASGVLLITNNPYFAVSSADGKFAIPHLPPGRWEFAFGTSALAF